MGGKTCPRRLTESNCSTYLEKKGKEKDCTSYRGISLLSHVGKMYVKVLKFHTRTIVEPYLNKTQFGFRKDRGYISAIFVLCQLCEKAYQCQQPLHLVFIDQEKAFNSINRSKLWEVLEAYAVNSQLLDSIRVIYTCSESLVKTPMGLTSWSKMTFGVQ